MKVFKYKACLIVASVIFSCFNSGSVNAQLDFSGWDESGGMTSSEAPMSEIPYRSGDYSYDFGDDGFDSVDTFGGMMSSEAPMSVSPYGSGDYSSDDFGSPFIGGANGCGEEGGQRFPERVGGVNLRPACNLHDECYGTYGSTKEYCDQKLEEDIAKSGAPVTGFIYGKAVDIFGDEAWNRAQNRSRELSPSWQLENYRNDTCLDDLFPDMCF